jgi:hypothetical protein
MEDGCDRAECLTGPHTPAELVAVDVIGKAAIGEIGEFLAVGEVVDDEDIRAVTRPNAWPEAAGNATPA